VIIHFHEPPPAQKVGGLDAAIRSMQAALETLGHTVLVNPSNAETAPDLVHFHGLWQRRFPKIAASAQNARIPIVVSPHGMLEPWALNHKRWKKLPYFHLVEKRWLSRAGCVLATAEPEGARLRELLPATRIESIPLGLTGDAHPDYAGARAQLGWREDETVLLYLSRLHEKKGLDLLIGALATAEKKANTRLVIVGPEEQPGFVQKCRLLAEKLSMNLPRIDWLGPVWGEGRFRFFQGADLFCLPTHSENFGLVVLESLQVGTPVLTTTGTPWGSLTPPSGYIAEVREDSIQAQLSRFAKTPLISPGQRAAIAESTRSLYHWDSLGRRYEALYKTLE
jgi:glycosyltransferase involved in cell wall biosynthesis